MTYSRRRFVRGTTAAAAAGMLLPRVSFARGHLPSEAPGASTLAERADPALMRQLAERAVDAARSAGASYADVRITRTVQSKSKTDYEEVGVGIRALAGGAWGFAASPFLRLDEMPVLARIAVAQARSTIRNRPEPLVLAPAPVASGEWTMPIEIDPFTVPIEEQTDFLSAFLRYAAEFRPGLSIDPQISFMRQEEVLATTEGTYVSQVRWNSTLSLVATFIKNDVKANLPLEGLQPSGRGWEALRNAKLIEQLPRIADELEMLVSLPIKPLDVGRYDVVFDAATMGALLANTLGVATELDRAVGMEANAGGTSYLGPDPLALLGTFQVGSPLVSVVADRSMRGGSATVRWDAEGVEPNEARLVTKGILTDYQTTREQAPWLAPYYQKSATPVRSHGYAAAQSGLDSTTQFTPNLSLLAAESTATMNDLMPGITNGIAVYGGYVSTDFQAKNGLITIIYHAREIKNGRLGAILRGAQPAFNTSELWKSVNAIGGASSTGYFENVSRKGQSSQIGSHTVRAVPARVSNIAFLRTGQR